MIWKINHDAAQFLGSMLTMDELAMYFAPRRVYDGYLKVLIIAQAPVTKMLCQNSAMRHCIGIRLELDPDSISERNTVYHIEEKPLHRITSDAPIRRVSIRSAPDRHL
jgi:hypothetical protein